ncbi:MAG: hypothetical protein ACTSRA_17520, partial [Promethearchaeota archaeon]
MAPNIKCPILHGYRSRTLGIFTFMVMILSSYFIFINNNENYQMKPAKLIITTNTNLEFNGTDFKASFIGPKGSIPNETLGNIYTGQNITVLINSTFASNPLIQLAISDLELFFKQRYNASINVLDDSGVLFNNSIIIGNETTSQTIANLKAAGSIQ